MNKFYFTFMFKQTLLKNKYVIVEANTEMDARKHVFHYLGDQCGFCYVEEGFDRQIQDFGLTEISLEEASKHLYGGR
jgi:hypothetical protein